LLLDIRREPSDDDRAMLDFLAETEVPTIVALTKVDKLSKAAARERAAAIAKDLALDSDQVIPFSSPTGEGRVELLEAILELVAAPVPEETEETAP
jgi:GTP-binding protein